MLWLGRQTFNLYLGWWKYEHERQNRRATHNKKPQTEPASSVLH